MTKAGERIDNIIGLMDSSGLVLTHSAVGS
jgi:hypothetical protein